jgi:XFP C-terminal domain
VVLTDVARDANRLGDLRDVRQPGLTQAADESAWHEPCRRASDHENIRVRGYKEKGTITTALDETVLNELAAFTW